MNPDITHLDPARAHRHTRTCFWDVERGRWRCPPRDTDVGTARPAAAER